MPMMDCPECTSEISDAAVACPHCGYPLATKSVSSQISDENTAQVSNLDGPEISLDAGNPDDIDARLHASLAHRSRMMFSLLAGLTLVTTLLVIPLFIDGLLKAFDSVGISFSKEGVLETVIAVVAVLFGYYIVKGIAGEIAELKFFACADDIERDELSSLELADGPPLSEVWHQLAQRYGGIFFDVSVSQLADQYFFHYKIRWGVGLAVLLILVLKGLLA